MTLRAAPALASSTRRGDEVGACARCVAARPGYGAVVPRSFCCAKIQCPASPFFSGCGATWLRRRSLCRGHVLAGHCGRLCDDVGAWLRAPLRPGAKGTGARAIAPAFLLWDDAGPGQSMWHGMRSRGVAGLDDAIQEQIAAIRARGGTITYELHHGTRQQSGTVSAIRCRVSSVARPAQRRLVRCRPRLWMRSQSRPRLAEFPFLT